jgi:predicted extracellular nuclease
VPTPTATEFTISHANLENFSSSNATKLNKASLAIRNVLHTPDVVGLIEIDAASSATALANKINADVGNPSAVNYVSYFSETAATQDIGYLVNSARVTVVGTPTPYHPATNFTYCGVTSVLHDRPSFVLNVDMPQQGGGTIPVTVTSRARRTTADRNPAPRRVQLQLQHRRSRTRATPGDERGAHRRSARG